MSFFAGNDKLHITNIQREISELDTNTIYQDTVFHSNMQSICSLGEYQAQAQVVGFQVNGQTEYCFEAAIPAEVRSHILDNKVVLVTMGNISTFINDTNPKEAPIAFPINVKIGSGAGIISDMQSYNVVTSPQVTAGGLLDISYSVNAIANRNIIVHSVDEGGDFNGEPLFTINGWSTDPDYSATAKVTNLIRPNSNYVQYHARGLRWRLEHYYVNGDQSSMNDTPYYVDLTGIMAPIFTFVVLNVRFSQSNVYEFINPLPSLNSNGIILEGDNLSINGTKFNTVKIIQSYNTNAVGSFIPGKYLNRLLPSMTYTNVSIDTTQTRQYKRWSMVNFVQGAKHTNGLPIFMKNPGTIETVECWNASNNDKALMGDVPYKAHVCTYGIDNFPTWEPAWDQLGYPMPGYATSYYDTYRRRSDTILFDPDNIPTGMHGTRIDKLPFAILDTSKFTSMYATKDGISGEYFDGTTTHTLPIWNTASPPTHMIKGTKNIVVPSSIWSVDLVTSTQSWPIVSYYMGFDRPEENLLVGVRISSTDVGTDLARPSTSHYGGDDYYMSCFDDKDLSSMYTSDGCVHGLVKLMDGEELVVAQMYLQGGSKWSEITGTPKYNKALKILSIGVFALYTLKRVGNSIVSYVRVKVDCDSHEEVAQDSVPLEELWTMSHIFLPRVDAYIVRIQ